MIIRDVLSGRYSGVPDAHIYNILYPFAWLLKLLYQCIPTVDFWGVCMIGLIFVCLYAILTRVFALNLSLFPKISLAVLTVAAFHFICSTGIVFFTFTFTASLCAATSLLLFITGSDENKPFKQYIPALVLLLLSFCIRKDTTFMVLPFFALWGLFLIVRSADRLRTLLHLLKPIGALVLCAAVLFGTHLLAFSSSEWQDFLEFRDLRKSVHDFGSYPDYAGAKTMYESIGLDHAEKNLVAIGSTAGINTVFDTDPDIRVVLKTVGEYNTVRRENTPESELTEAARKRITSFYQPFEKYYATGLVTLFACVSLVAVCLYALSKHKYGPLIFVMLGAVLVSAEIWGLAYLGRMTFPVIRSLLLLGMLWCAAVALYVHRMTDTGTHKVTCRTVFAVICAAVILTLGCIATEQNNRNSIIAFEKNTIKTRDLRAYCLEHSDHIYFQPAFSISKHTDSTYLPFDSAFNNLILLGGWNAFSPEYQQSLQTGGLGDLTVEQALLTKDNAYMLSVEEYSQYIIKYFEWKYGDRFSYTVTPIPALTYETNSIALYDFALDS